MKWFKHYSDNHRGRSINTLLDVMGHAGLSYFLLVEMCAEKVERKSGKTLERSDLLFRFRQRIVRQNLRLSLAKVELLLGTCQELALLSYEKIGEEFEIKMPMLLDLLDSDSKKSRYDRDTVATRTRLDKDKDKDKEIDKEKYKKENDVQASLHWTSELWNELCGNLPKVQSDKVRRKKIASMLKNFPERDQWALAIKNLAESPFCNGDNERGWRADFDFLLQAKSFGRALENFYSKPTAKHGKSSNLKGFTNERKGSDWVSFEELNRQAAEEREREQGGRDGE